MKIHNAAIIPLTTKFDGTAARTSSSHMFLKNIKEHGQSFGWDDILNIPNEDGRTRKLIHQYGLITLHSIRACTDSNKPSERANKRGVTKFCGHFRLLILGHC